MSTNASTPTPAAEPRDAYVLKSAASSGGLGELELRAFTKAVVKYCWETFAPDLMEKFVEPLVKSRTRRLEERMRAQEERRLLESGGIWNRSSEYFIGNVVTHDGSAWECLRDNTSRDIPGKSDAWRLLVKRGNDANVGGIERRFAALEQRFAALEQKLGDAG